MTTNSGGGEKCPDCGHLWSAHERCRPMTKRLMLTLVGALLLMGAGVVIIAVTLALVDGRLGWAVVGGYLIWLAFRLAEWGRKR